MSTANPEKAVRAILPVPIQCKCGCTVRPVTLGVFAVLERIKSPLLGETPVDGPLSLIPSLYALTHDPADSLAPNLYERSLEWADTLPPSALAEIRDAAERQCAAMLDVVPQSAASKNSRRNSMIVLITENPVVVGKMTFVRFCLPHGGGEAVLNSISGISF